MSDVAILITLYVIGALILVAEIFIPSHGILTLAGVGFLVAAVTKTFSYGGREAGIVAVLTCMVLLPIFAFLAIKYWHLTPVGRRIAPPNPVLTAADTGVPVEELTKLIGQVGRTVSPHRPVGISEFNGRRVSCVVELEMVEAGVTVEGTGIKGSNLIVVEKKA